MPLCVASLLAVLVIGTFSVRAMPGAAAARQLLPGTRFAPQIYAMLVQAVAGRHSRACLAGHAMHALLAASKLVLITRCPHCILVRRHAGIRVGLDQR